MSKEVDSAMTGMPKLGALAVVVRNGAVLLVRRRNAPNAGLWGFPGGHVEWGETALTAAARELREETGVTARPLGYLTNIDVLRHAADGRLTHHYLLAAVLCADPEGDPAPADDVDAASWIDVDALAVSAIETSPRVLDLARLALRRNWTDLGAG